MNTAIILAGGTGERMQTSGKPKQFISLYGKPIIIYTLEKFEDNENIDEIVVVCIKDWINQMKKVIKKYNITKVKAVIEGGATRQLSIFNALNYIYTQENDQDYVIIHDGVRPLITDRIINENFDIAKKYGNAFTVVKCNESILVSLSGISSRDVPDRHQLYIEQGPQTLPLAVAYQYFNQIYSEGHTDMTAVCSIMQYLNKEMFFVEGDYKNIKITTPSDYYVFKAFKDLEDNKDAFGY